MLQARENLSGEETAILLSLCHRLHVVIKLHSWFGYYMQIMQGSDQLCPVAHLLMQVDLLLIFLFVAGLSRGSSGRGSGI